MAASIHGYPVRPSFQAWKKRSFSSQGNCMQSGLSFIVSNLGTVRPTMYAKSLMRRFLVSSPNSICPLLDVEAYWRSWLKSWQTERQPKRMYGPSESLLISQVMGSLGWVARRLQKFERRLRPSVSPPTHEFVYSASPGPKPRSWSDGIRFSGSSTSESSGELWRRRTRTGSGSGNGSRGLPINGKRWRSSLYDCGKRPLFTHRISSGL